MEHYEPIIRASLTNIAVGRAGIGKIKSVDDAQAWVDENGGGEAGELALRNALAGLGKHQHYSINMALEWLARQEQARASAYENAILAAAQRSTMAAERSAFASERAARYAMWTAAISAAVGIVSAAAYWVSRIQA
jgi:hypothetical protein